MPAIKSNKSTASALETTSKTTTKVVSTGLPLVNKEKAIEAINALNKYFEQKQLTEPLNILEENKKIYITFETDKYYHNSLFKPHHIVAPHKIGELSEKRTLVIIEGGKVDAINLKTKLVDLGYTGAVDVLSMKEFKNEYVTKEQIIKVRKTYDEFVVDNFYKQKIQHKFGKEFQNSPQSPKLSIIDQKNPVELIETLNKLDRMVLVRRFTELFFTLPVGTSDLPVEQLIENVAFIVGEVSNKLPEKINSIQSLSIAGSDISLPFYVNVKVPSNLLFNSKENKVELNPLAIQQENNNNNNNTSEESTTNTTTNTKSNKKRTEPESEEKEQEQPIKEKPNKKSKTTPVKEVKSTPAAVVAKPTTPVKEVKETPIKSKTPVKESTPAVVAAAVAAKPTTPAKQVKETPIKSKTPVKESTPQETTTPSKPTKTPTKATTTTAAPKEVESTPVKEVKQTPAKQVKETPVKQVKETPVKQVKETPVKQVKETPVKEVKETPVKQVKETPVKQVKETVKEVAAPVKEVKETPVKEVAAPVAKKVTKKAAAAPVEVAPVEAAPVKKVVKKATVAAAPVEAAPVKKVVKKAAAAPVEEAAPVKKVVKKTATTATATASKLKKPIEKK
ncbi:ribosomal protein L1 family protein [Dictyostelium discoideum AX4]|uniref:Ribosomal protein L1 family protein n=1 Tax=Dictyostelium discoideum TaxID=44689 RepID=Q55G29_DICDI|nr:ribosomal protein L1 family protein [Dictyostelium discoideum AX4]EAL73378.2 ribosomal protein L1 family protein [Dictyostelium discoideum AX4]|eukprot:XP_647354.2 ribosomal protein L1 family protein [Dictyostelium discoideum AX4]